MDVYPSEPEKNGPGFTSPLQGCPGPIIAQCWFQFYHQYISSTFYVCSATSLSSIPGDFFLIKEIVNPDNSFSASSSSHQNGMSHSASLRVPTASEVTPIFTTGKVRSHPFLASRLLGMTRPVPVPPALFIVVLPRPANRSVSPSLQWSRTTPPPPTSVT